MNKRREMLCGAGALLLAGVSPAALLLATSAEARSENAPPLDVPYVPTPMPVVDVMLDMARVKREDVLYDLGCGDGRIVVRAASQFGCRGVGVDLNPERVAEARANAASHKVTERTHFEVGDVFEFDFSP